MKKSLTNCQFEIRRIARPILILALSWTSLGAQNYYPLAVGNRWDYIDYYSDLVHSSTDTLAVWVKQTAMLPNGKEYFELNCPDIAGGRFVRVDSAAIYYYDETDSSEVLLFKLNAQLNEVWQFHSNPDLFAGLVSIDTVLWFDVLTRVLTFSRDGVIPNSVSFSDEFGPLTFSFQEVLTSNLITASGCLIGGITYGNLLVNVESSSVEPSQFHLAQNYPNPFNGTTSIAFELQAESPVQLSIFNPLGQVVATFEIMGNSGRNQVTWDAQGLSSGIYFYRLESGSLSQTRKLVLIR